MKLGSRHKADPSFNMSSMTDVVFLLLIFFIMTSSNITPVGKKVNLPKSSNKDTIKIQRVAITIDKDLNLQIDNDPTNETTMIDMIEARLSPKHDDKNKNVIVVRGDEKVEYGEVMKVVQICSKVDNAVVTLQLDPN